MARSIPYTGVPDVLPQATAPEDYQRIQTNPSQFGAQIGTGEEELGAGALKASDYYGQVAGENAYTQYQHSINNMLFGDPSVPNDPGFMGLSGEDAMKARPIIQQKMEDLLAQTKDQLPTGQSQLDFERSSRRLQAISIEQMGRHYEQQANVWGASVQQGAMVEDQRGAGLNYNDDEFLKHKIADQDVLATRWAQHTGKDPISTAAEWKSGIVHSAINGALAQNDLAGATHIKDTFGSLLDPAVGAVVAGHLRSANAAAIGDQWLNEASRSAGATGASGATPQAPEKYAPLIKSSAQQYGVPEELLTRVLSAESGFVPTAKGQPIAKLGGVSAQGIAQFLPETAARYGANPNDPNSAIPAAAHYLADLKAERGTWNGAVSGYLGGDPHNSDSYIKNGVPQLIDALDRGGAPTQLLPPDQAAAGAPSATGVQPIPLPGVNPTPPAPPAPGMDSLAQSELQEMQRHASMLDYLGQRQAQNPEAWAHAVQKEDLNNRNRLGLIAAQKQMIFANRSAAVTGYTKELRPDAPVPPDFYDRITNDQRLDGETLRTLYALAQTHAKNSVTGDLTQYGPQFYEAYNRITLPNDNPQRLWDAAQVLAMAKPKEDGTQDLTLAGAGKIIQSMDEAKKRDPILTQKKKELLQLIIPHDEAKMNEMLPARRQDVYNLNWDIDQQITQAEVAGKSPYNLFNPTSPDFLGKHYQEQIDANALKTKLEGDPAMKTQAGIVAAFQAKKLTREQAADALRHIGVPFVDPQAAPAVPQVPGR